MNKRFLTAAAAFLALAACGPSISDSVPNSGTGAGFGSYDEYKARAAAREAQLNGSGMPAPPAVIAQPPGGSMAAEGASSADDIAAQTRAALGISAPSSVPATSMIQPARPLAPPITNSSGISAENNFDVVSSSRSIEDDAARVAAQQQQYEVASVESLPSRHGDEGPNIVAYALATKHVPGETKYKRIGLNKQAKYERNCAIYPGPDMAQLDFLAKGGPARDRMGLDPDGDGFACSWDPRPFRKAAGG